MAIHQRVSIPTLSQLKSIKKEWLIAHQLKSQDHLSIPSGEDLAPDQAIGLQARAAIKMDPKIENLDTEERLYLEGCGDVIFRLLRVKASQRWIGSKRNNIRVECYVPIRM